MDDFKAGRDIKVDGDVNINNGSNDEYKLLLECTNDELHEERVHRTGVLKDEIKRKRKHILSLLKVALIVIVIIAAWYQLVGEIDLVMMIVAGMGVFLPIASAIKLSDRQTVFEIRQINALNEIAMLLRERGAE